jgi:hypothetical protein
MTIPSPNNPRYEEKLNEIISLIKDKDPISTKWWERMKEFGLKEGLIRQDDFDYIAKKLE